MDGARPREEFVERRCHLFVAVRIVTREEDGSVWLARFANRRPVKIAAAVGRKAEAPAPALLRKVNRVFLALEIERKERFDPFSGIFGTCVGMAHFELFG